MLLTAKISQFFFPIGVFKIFSSEHFETTNIKLLVQKSSKDVKWSRVSTLKDLSSSQQKFSKYHRIGFPNFHHQGKLLFPKSLGCSDSRGMRQKFSCLSKLEGTTNLIRLLFGLIKLVGRLSHRKRAKPAFRVRNVFDSLN